MGSQKTKSENRPTPEVLQLFNKTQSQYSNPDGTLKSSPTVDPTSAASQQRADQLVAPRSAATNQAHQSVFNNVGAWQGGMDDARSAITSGMGPTGQKIDFQGGGWSTGADGNAVFNSQDAYNQSYNQYTGQVLDNTLSRLSDQYAQTQLNTNDAAIKAGSFGGSRQAVANSLNTDNYLRNVSETSNKAYSDAHNNALSQIQSLYGMGSSAIGANNALDAQNATRMMQGGQALSDLEQRIGEFRAGDTNALAAVGADQEAYDQSRRNAVLEESQRQHWEPLQTAQALAGMMPNTGSTTQSQSGGTGALIAGAALKGLSFLSDKRAKEGIKDAAPDKALDELRQLVPQTYSYTDDAQALGAPAGERTGFMAQDLEAATGQPSPEMPGGFKGVDISEHIGRLTHAVIALDQKISGKAKAA